MRPPSTTTMGTNGALYSTWAAVYCCVCGQIHHIITPDTNTQADVHNDSTMQHMTAHNATVRSLYTSRRSCSIQVENIAIHM